MKFLDAIQHSLTMFDSTSFIERIIEEDETMLPRLPILKQINSLGFLTIESQGSGRPKKTPKGMSLQRAYCMGFMLESQAASFIAEMSIFTDKVIFHLPFFQDNEKSKKKTNVSRELDIPLTILVSSTKSTPKIETHTSTVIPLSVWDFYRKEAKINKSEKIVLLYLYDPIWNRDAQEENGLFTRMVEILTRIK
jgi:hypothetical protein